MEIGIKTGQFDDHSEIVIRNETEADVSAISEVTVDAFKTLEQGTVAFHEGFKADGRDHSIV